WATTRTHTPLIKNGDDKGQYDGQENPLNDPGLGISHPLQHTLPLKEAPYCLRGAVLLLFILENAANVATTLPASLAGHWRIFALSTALFLVIVGGYKLETEK